MIRRKTSRIKNMFKNKSLKARIAAAVLAAAVAFTSFDVTAFAGNSSDSSIIYEENILSEDISADDYDISGDETVTITVPEESAPEREQTEKSPRSDEEILEDFMAMQDINYTYHEMESDKNAPIYEGDEDNRFYGDTLPSSYHTSLDYLRSTFPATRNQNPWGSCWAHSAMASAEISLITQGYKTKSVDYSELALAYFFYNTVTDPLGGTAGDYATLGCGSDEILTNVRGLNHVNVLDRGGNNSMTWRSLATWMAVIDESYAPYAPYNDWDRDCVSYLNPDIAYKRSAILTDVRIFNSSETDAIKRAIMENGIVACSYLSDNHYYRDFGDYTSYYYNEGTGSNHAVAIVGWDDNFSRYNFYEATFDSSGKVVAYTSNPAPKDGAWLVRNSWSYYGTEMSKYSYFWMSYYDTSLNANNMYEQIFAPANTYDNNYQYDGAIQTFGSGYYTVANVFTIGGEAGATSEDLKAVAFTTNDVGMDYNIKVYQNITAGSPESGTLVANKTGTTTHSGYYTVNLDTPVKMSRGTTFSVVIETKNGYVSQEINNTVNYWIKMYSASKPGQSYYKSSGWRDFSTYNGNTGNICIKAFTSNSSGSSTPGVSTYRIVYDGNGSTSGSMSAVDVSTSVGYTLSTNNFTRDYYKFKGWNTKADGTGISYANGATIPAQPANSVLTLYAQWDEDFYTIVYNGNGATSGSMTNGIGSTRQFIRGCSYSKTGYHFVSWNTKPDGSGTTYVPNDYFEPVPVKTVVNLYAQWAENTYTISFSPNGASGDTIVYDNVSYLTDFVFPANTFTREGYTFKGWSADSFEYGNLYRPGDKYSGPASKTHGESTTFYAIWQEETSYYTLNYHLDGESGVYTTKTITYMQAYGTLYTPSKTGYKFLGWYTAATGGTKVTASTIHNVKSDVDIYAHWDENRYHVIFQPGNNVSGDPLIFNNLSYKEQFTFPENPYSYPDHIFEGWYKSSNPGTLYQPGETIDPPTGNYDGQTLYYYARWRVDNNEYNLHFFLDGESSAWYTKKIVYNQTYGTLPSPLNQKEGYEFLGWYTEPEGGTMVSSSTIHTIKADVSVYAHWRYIPKNTVTFDLQGGLFTTTVENTTIVYDNAALVKPADPIKANAEFLGWKKLGEEEYYDFDEAVTEDFTLVAQWKLTLYVSPVTADPASGSEIEASEEIILSCFTLGATIYYTTDGSEPTESSEVYSSSISFESPGSYVIKAFAVKDGYNPGPVSEFTYTVIEPVEDWGDVSEEDRAGFEHSRELPSGLWVRGIPESVDYTGYAIKFDDLRVYDNKTLLVKNSSYKITYKNNTNAGTATVTITGAGNYSGLLNESFIINAVDIDEEKVTVPDVKYQNKTGTAFSPVRIIGLNGTILKKATDFNVSYTYSDDTTVKNGSKTITRVAGSTVNSADIVPNGTEIVATITGKGNYKTEAPIIRNYFVTSEGLLTDLSKATVTIAPQVYTGKPINLIGNITVRVGNKYLNENEDYVISGYSANRTNVGSATVTIEGIYKPEEGKYFVGAKTVKFTIKAKAVSAATLGVALRDGSVVNWTSDFNPDYEYAGSAIKPAVRLTDDEKVLIEGKDYTIKYVNNINSTSSKKVPAVTITGKGNYSGSLTRKFDITTQELEKETSYVVIPTVYATGLANSYKVKAAIADKNGRTLTENKDYKLNYLRDGVPVSSTYRPAAGDWYTVRVSGIGGYSGHFDKEIETQEQINIEVGAGETYEDSRLKVWIEDIVNPGSFIPYSLSAQAEYSAKGAKLNIKISDAETSFVLTEGKDYTISYKNNKSRASYTATKAPTLVITGKGLYKGTLSLKYNIISGSVHRANVTVADKVYSTSSNGFVSKPVVKDCFGNTLKSGTDYTVVYKYAVDTYIKSGALRLKDTVISSKDVLPVGTPVKLEIQGKGNYVGSWTSGETYEGSGIYASYKIVAGNLSSAKVTVKEQFYTGKALMPGKSQMTVKIGKTTLTDDDYEIVSYSNNISKGTAKVVLRGVGNYAGTKTATFKISQRTMYMTVVFNGNGSTGGSMSKLLVASGKATKLTSLGFTRTGYVSDKINGAWNTKPDGTGTYYDNGGYIDNVGHNGDTVVLYAQWMEIDKPTNVTVSRASSVSNASTQQIVRWNAVSGASGYAIYRATSLNGTYSKVGTSTSTSYTSKNLSAGKTYYYKVAATVKETVNGKVTTITGNMSDSIGVLRTKAKPNLSGHCYITYYGDNVFYTAIKNNGSQDFNIVQGQNVYVTAKRTFGYATYNFTGTLYYSGSDNTISPGSSRLTYWGGAFGMTNYSGCPCDITFLAIYDGMQYEVKVTSDGNITTRALKYID